MADLSKIRLNGTNYNLKDAVAREGLAAIQDSLENIHEQEDDDDVKAMLESLNLTVIDENNNIVGLAIVGKATVQSPPQGLVGSALVGSTYVG